MINTIIKRSGRKVKFQPEKLNKLANWAVDHNVDWPTIALNALKKLSDECTVTDLVQALITACLDEETEAHIKVAGKLYISDLYKRVFDKEIPLPLNEYLIILQQLGYYQVFDYTQEEIQEIASFVDHDRDFNLSYTQIKQMESKYFVRDKVNNITYETPQFMCIRIAMATMENKSKATRVNHVRKYYNWLSVYGLSLPSPNWSFIGTVKKTGTSCCLSTGGDTIPSIVANDHVAYMMTVASAGIGNNLQTRTLGSGVRGNTIKHLGKLNYFRDLQAGVKANMQSGRGGALTTYVSILDPELQTLIHLRNPKSVEDKRINGIDYALLYNNYFVKKVSLAEDWMLIDYALAPDLYEAFYTDNIKLFVEIYERYEKDKSVKKSFLNARDIAIEFLTESFDTGRFYDANIYEINKHTPFKESIHSSNLCLEICLPTKPYKHITDLYKDNDEPTGEVATCNIAAINLGRDYTDEEYEELCYYALTTIDHVILNSEYILPHVGYTSKQRMSAGVGLMNVAYEMARKKKYYSAKSGKQFLHELAERHYYFLVKASLRISKERGNAPWIHKTKWVEGWLPIDTYNKNVDSIAPFENKYDWEALRAEVIANGGIAHSVLCAYMPGESSSQVSNSTNSLYAIRDGVVIKTDGSSKNIFIAPRFEELREYYEIAWDISTKDMIDVYAIFQKWCDQAISADYYKVFPEGVEERVLSSDEMVTDFCYRTTMGVKTKYYTNSSTQTETELNGCGSGGCTL